MNADFFPTKRALLGLVVAGPIAVLATRLLLSGPPLDDAQGWLSLLVLALVFEGIVLIIGVPVLLILRYRNLTSLKAWATGVGMGSAALVLPFVVLAKLGPTPDASGNAFADGSIIGMGLVPLALVIGALGGAVWWWITFGRQHAHRKAMP